MRKARPLRKIIVVTVELSCAPGTTKVDARRELRDRVNTKYWQYRDDQIRAKRIS